MATSTGRATGTSTRARRAGAVVPRAPHHRASLNGRSRQSIAGAATEAWPDAGPARPDEPAEQADERTAGPTTHAARGLIRVTGTPGWGPGPADRVRFARRQGHQPCHQPNRPRSLPHALPNRTPNPHQASRCRARSGRPGPWARRSARSRAGGRAGHRTSGRAAAATRAETAGGRRRSGASR